MLWGLCSQGYERVTTGLREGYDGGGCVRACVRACVARRGRALTVKPGPYVTDTCVP